MRRSRFSLSLFAAAAVAAPLLASADPRYGLGAAAGAYLRAAGISNSVTDLGTLPYGVLNDPEDLFTLPADELGQVAGYLGMAPLSIPDELHPAFGWTIADAAAVSDMQQIAGRACRAGVCPAVTPDLAPAVPEPPVAALLAAGLALGLARGKSGVRRPVRRRRG